jgi:hypothetical protein
MPETWMKMASKSLAMAGMVKPAEAFAWPCFSEIVAAFSQQHFVVGFAGALVGLFASLKCVWPQQPAFFAGTGSVV